MFLPTITIMIILLKFSQRVDAEFSGSPIDAARICWSDEEIAIDNATLPIIIYFLQSCFDTLAQLHSPYRNELSSVLSLKIQDLIPVVNKAFYEENVDYSIVRDLHRLYNDMRSQKINSLQNKMRKKRNWIKIRSSRSLEKQRMPLIIRANQTEKEEACNTLIVSSNSGSRIRRKVPLPFLDNIEKPRRIAVPFISKPLYNLNDSDAKSLLIKYYVTGVKCLSLSSEHNQDILVFNRNFYIWLVKCILPKIERNNKLYPAFGGVLKILQTIQDKGIVDLNQEIESTIGREICIKPSTLSKVDKAMHAESVSKKSGKVAIASSSFCIIITLVLTTFLFLTWLLIVFLFLFCRCCRYHYIKSENQRAENEKGSKEILMENIEGAQAIKGGPKPLTNEIRPVSTEFQPLITSTPDRELTKFTNQIKCESEDLIPEKEKLKNTGFSKFLAPLKKEKSETQEEEPLIKVDPKIENEDGLLAEVKKSDNKNSTGNSKSDPKWQCSRDLSKWQCTENRSKWHYSQEKAVSGGGMSETTIKVYPKSLKLSHKASAQTGKCPYKSEPRSSQVGKEQSTSQVASENMGKLSASNSSLSDKSSSNTLESEGIEIDSNYKCEIKFVGEPPKCEQCSENFYNDVKQMLQVLKDDSTMKSGTDTSDRLDNCKEDSENQKDERCAVRKKKRRIN